jgi:hypothetical protein
VGFAFPKKNRQNRTQVPFRRFFSSPFLFSRQINESDQVQEQVLVQDRHVHVECLGSNLFIRRHRLRRLAASAPRRLVGTLTASGW